MDGALYITQVMVDPARGYVGRYRKVQQSEQGQCGHHHASRRLSGWQPTCDTL